MVKINRLEYPNFVDGHRIGGDCRATKIRRQMRHFHSAVRCTRPNRNPVFRNNTMLMPPKKISPRARRAFTLIELLTVVAIVGILTAILLPVVSRVKKSARQTEWVSNMHQMDAAMLMATADNHGRLPGPLYTGSNPQYRSKNPYTLSYVIYPYVGGAPAQDVAFQVLAILDNPDYDNYTGLALTLREPLFLNPKLYGRPAGNPDGSNIMPLMLNAVTNPAMLFFFQESLAFNGVAATADTPAVSVHGDNTIFYAFADGHVAGIPLSVALKEPYLLP